VKVFITGSLGTLGSAVAAALSDRGHDTVGVDIRPPAEVTCDIRELSGPAGAAVFAGADAVVHLASLHGRDHMSRFGPDAFWDVNVEGTRAVYAAAAAAGVRRVVLAGSMAVYGPIPVKPLTSWRVVREQDPVTAYDSYSMTKLVCERLAQYHASRDGISTTVLRFGHFTPADVDHYGFRLLFGGVDVRDAATAVRAALCAPSGGDGDGSGAVVRALNIHALSPFTPRDLPALGADPVAALRGLRPAVLADLERSGIEAEPLLWGRALWPAEGALAALDWRPVWDFDRYAAARLAGDLSDYAGLAGPRWGVD
jgi:UDP-glucose 4-epimerase